MKRNKLMSTMPRANASAAASRNQIA
jgi:hypothetical protein